MAKSKIFLFLLIAFIAGIGARSFGAFPLLLILLGTVAALFTIGAGILQKRKDFILYGFLIFSFFTGVFRFDYVESRAPDLTDLYEKEIEIVGIVITEPVLRDSSTQVKIQVESLDNLAIDSFNVLATVRLYPKYKIGDELLFRGTLKAPENFNEFDYVSYLAKENIFAIILYPDIEKIGSNKGSKILLGLSKLKSLFEGNIEAVLPEPHASFLKGLLLGDRESLPKDLVDNFSKTGTTHIVALSGYNITIIGRFFIGLLLFLTVPFYISFWIASSAIILFIIMTGASPSIVRAGIMGILVLVAEREGRMYRITNALVFAAACMIFLNPYILRFDTAFELSFLATAGLIYLSPLVGRFFDNIKEYFGGKKFSARGGSVLGGKSPGVKEKVFSMEKTLIETLAAQIMVLPLLMYLFGKFSLISPIVNILVLMAVPYSMAIGFFTGILGFVSEPLARISGVLNWLLLEYKIRVINFFAQLPWATIEVGTSATFVLLIIYLVLYLKLNPIPLRNIKKLVQNIGRGNARDKKDA